MIISPRVSVVTGASGGIGLAIVRALLLRGDKVVAQAFRHPDRLDSLRHEFGNSLTVDAVDLRDPKAAAELVDRAAFQNGALHFLVHAAGATHDNLLGTSTDAEFQDLLATNYLSAVACARAAARPMMRQRFGRMVFVSSVAAHLPGRGQSNYAGTKGALEAFARALAAELGPKAITVNCVAPGVIETEMTDEVRALGGEEILARTALGRYGAPGEVAAAVAFLASDDAGFITGTSLRVDGGWKLR